MASPIASDCFPPSSDHLYFSKYFATYAESLLVIIELLQGAGGSRLTALLIYSVSEVTLFMVLPYSVVAPLVLLRSAADILVFLTFTPFMPMSPNIDLVISGIPS